MDSFRPEDRQGYHLAVHRPSGVLDAAVRFRRRFDSLISAISPNARRFGATSCKIVRIVVCRQWSRLCPFTGKPAINPDIRRPLNRPGHPRTNLDEPNLVPQHRHTGRLLGRPTLPAYYSGICAAFRYLRGIAAQTAWGSPTLFEMFAPQNARAGPPARKGSQRNGIQTSMIACSQCFAMPARVAPTQNDWFPLSSGTSTPFEVESISSEKTLHPSSPPQKGESTCHGYAWRSLEVVSGPLYSI